MYMSRQPPLLPFKCTMMKFVFWRVEVKMSTPFRTNFRSGVRPFLESGGRYLPLLARCVTVHKATFKYTRNDKSEIWTAQDWMERFDHDMYVLYTKQELPAMKTTVPRVGCDRTERGKDVGNIKKNRSCTKKKEKKLQVNHFQCDDGGEEMT